MVQARVQQCASSQMRLCLNLVLQMFGDTILLLHHRHASHCISRKRGDDSCRKLSTGNACHHYFL